MSLTEGRLTEGGGMRGLEAATNRVTEDHGGAPPVGLDIFHLGQWADAVGTSSSPPSAPFATVSGDLLVCLCHLDGGNLVPMPTTTPSGPVWTRQPNNQIDPGVAIFTAPVTADQASMTINIGIDAIKRWAGAYRVRGAHASPIGVTGGVQNASSKSIDITYTASVAGSATFVIDNEYFECGPMDANATLTDEQPLQGGAGYPGWTDGIYGYRLNAAATSQTITIDAGPGGGSAWHTYHYVEIKPA